LRSLSPTQALFFGLVLSVALIAALFPFFPRKLTVNDGDIAARDIRSPRAETFQSDELTEQAREQAAQAVPDVLVYDANVRAEQLSRLQDAIERIGAVLNDDSLSEATKRAELLAVRDLGLSRASIDTILRLPPERLQELQADADQLLSEVTTGSIAPDGVQAEQDTLLERVNPSLSADEAVLVADLTRPLIVPTLVIDEDATDAARDAARASVEPVQQSVAENQLIVQAGQRIDGTAVELLEEVGLVTPRVRWRTLVSVLGVAPLAAAILTMYLWNYPTRGLRSQRNLVLLALVIAVPVLIAKTYFSLVLPEGEERYLAYFLPLAAAPMLVAALLDARLAMMIGMVQAALMMFAVIALPDLSLAGTVDALDAGRVLLVYGGGAIVGSFAVRRAERANQYVLGGVLVMGTALVLLFSTWLLQPTREPIEALWMVGAASVAGVSSGFLTAGGFALAGTLLGVTTRVQLMELSQLNAPLLRRLQDEAPGTFHHSIIVANLAERAADLVGADPLLVRVGCYYHDIGKALQPGYYIENQLAGANPHDSIDPHISARIIADHIRGGLALANQYGLPLAVQAFIPEHHGTRLIPYFYRVASQKDANVDERPFRYPGPKPQSKETAIVMLADSTEAMVRSSEDRSQERIDQIVEQVLAERLDEGELEDCDLTFRDLRTIAQSFKQTLRGVYHPRIAYPEPTEPERRALIGRFRPGRRAPQFPKPAPPPQTSRSRERTV
jgi:hypothetical protein